MKGSTYVIILVVGIILFTWGMWKFERWIHYSFAYESKVENTICSMVKPETLKDPTQCE